MSDPAVDDVLLSADTRDRLCYALGVLLDASDFDAEQAYHRGRLARALVYLNGMGTAAGALSEPFAEAVAMATGAAPTALK